MNRIDRIESLLLAEISQALLRDIQDPRIGLVTLTHADVSKDLANAKIYVSVMGDEATRKRTMEALDSSAGYLKNLLGKRLHLRRIPRLQFVEDPSLRQADRINRMLEED
jgi:ribosome-binding factor A